MEAYRDQYAEIFRGGRKVALIGISNDPPEDLFSWAKEADFPFLFASDSEGATVAAFGYDRRSNNMVERRSVIVVDPEGRIAWKASPFREIDPTSYVELQAAIAQVAPPLGDEEGMDER